MWQRADRRHRALHDALALRADRKGWLVVLPVETFAVLLKQPPIRLR